MDFKQNYFQLFSIPVAFDVDLSIIKSRYRELQRNLHPDRYANSTSNEKLLSMQMSSFVNEAMDVLQSPVKRAGYLLELAGHPVDFEINIAMDPEFLMEQMDLREKLGSVKETEDPEKELSQFLNLVSSKITELILEFEGLFDEISRLNKPGSENALFDLAEKCVRKMQFINKLQTEAIKIEEELFD